MSPSAKYDLVVKLYVASILKRHYLNYRKFYSKRFWRCYSCQPFARIQSKIVLHFVPLNAVCHCAGVTVSRTESGVNILMDAS